MIVGQIYRCQNLKCHSEVQVIKSYATGRQNPRCCCGAEMKKPYTPPVLRELPSEMKVLIGHKSMNIKILGLLCCSG